MLSHGFMMFQAKKKKKKKQERISLSELRMGKTLVSVVSLDSILSETNVCLKGPNVVI